jgi:hypothetical protein
LDPEFLLRRLYLLGKKSVESLDYVHTFHPFLLFLIGSPRPEGKRGGGRNPPFERA